MFFKAGAIGIKVSYWLVLSVCLGLVITVRCYNLNNGLQQLVECTLMSPTDPAIVNIDLDGDASYINWTELPLAQDLTTLNILLISTFCLGWGS